MQLKNYQEDLVLHVIQIALEDRPEIAADEVFIHDVAAYALNRLPPRYIQSERGFTRLALSHACDDESSGELAGMLEMLLLVNRAIDIVRNRREAGAGNGTAVPALQGAAGAAAPRKRAARAQAVQVPTELGYWHNFPYLLGRVVDAKSGEPVYGVTVTAYLDGEPAPPAEAGWQNPYHTLRATRGYYSFLPRSVQSGEEKRHFTLRLAFDHPDYKPDSLERVIKTQGEFEVRATIGSEDIMNLEVIRLAARA